MDIERAYKELEQIIDALLAGNKVSIVGLINSIDEVSTCVLESYDNSRALVQRTIGLLEKSPEEIIHILLYEIQDFLNHILSYHSLEVENSQSIYSNYVARWSDEDLKTIFNKVLSSNNENRIFTRYYEQLATALSPNERKQFVDIVISQIQQLGTQTQWDKETVNFQYTIFCVLYAVCKYDEKMRLYFRVANNFIDRLPSSTNQQITRDFAESLLVIGHTEHVEIDAYLSASRAYTLCHGTLSGLFYLQIVIRAIIQSGRKLATDEVFEILWQMLKILRHLPWYDSNLINTIVRRFKELSSNGYEVISFMCTVFSVKLVHQQPHVASEILDFLNEYREQIMRNLAHSAAPWTTLLSQLERLSPESFNDQLKMYKGIFETNLERNGNERLVDYLNGENLAEHLFESIRQLEHTRNLSDYVTDNKSAIEIANRLLPDAVARASVGDFVLAMRVKTDFTFIFKETYQKDMYHPLEIDDVTGICDTPYRHINMLPHVMCMDKNDSALWIANVQDLYYYMTLKESEYDINELESLRNINVAQLKNIISQQQYLSDGVDKYGCYYKKSKQDHESDNEAFKNHFGQYTLPVPPDTQRLLIIKDVSITAIPQQLLSMPSGELIGEYLPSANVISTEFMIQSNFYNNISSAAKVNFWIPLDSGDIALNQMWSHLEDCISTFGMNIFTTKSIDEQLNGEINIVCAHGAKSIDQTEWFYANDEPIKDVDDIVGGGKVLILLVCHAGTMSSGYYDTAVHSIIKRFVRKGYCSVVAPVWSLSTEIVPLWLEVFMNELHNKKAYVIDAVYRANMAVKEEFTAISAWACMHLYGNPYLQINKEPSLSLREKNI